MAQVIWITGRPGTGKTTLAQKICKKYKKCVMLDADELRWAFGYKGFSERERNLWVLSIGHLAYLLYEQGFTPVVAMVSPYKEIRRRIFNDFFDRNIVTLIHLPGGEDRMWEGSVYQEPSSSEAGRYLERKYRI